MTDQPEDATYEPLMPFVVCQTQGGPYEDQAFVAGYTASEIDTTLRGLAHQPCVIWRMVPAALVPQIDLIAMRYGWKCHAEATGQGDWTQVSLHPDGWLPPSTCGQEES